MGKSTILAVFLAKQARRFCQDGLLRKAIAIGDGLWITFIDIFSSYESIYLYEFKLSHYFSRKLGRLGLVLFGIAVSARGNV